MVGEQLRSWRERRHVSQLDLSLQAGISARHLSFVETGRSKPSSGLILRLSEELDVPLRERNVLLLAGGFAPAYPEHGLDAPPLSAVTEAMRQVITAHMPNPALAVDGHWELIDANDAVSLLTEGTAAELMEPPVNVLRVSLHPDGMAPRIANLRQWRSHLLAQLERRIEATGDGRLQELYGELSGYPDGYPASTTEAPSRTDVVLPLRYRQGERELSFFSISAVVGTAADVTVDELVIESFFPADLATAEFLRGQVPSSV